MGSAWLSLAMKLRDLAVGMILGVVIAFSSSVILGPAEKTGRFQLIQHSKGYATIKIDTATGQSWIMNYGSSYWTSVETEEPKPPKPKPTPPKPIPNGNDPGISFDDGFDSGISFDDGSEGALIPNKEKPKGLYDDLIPTKPETLDIQPVEALDVQPVKKKPSE